MLRIALAGLRGHAARLVLTCLAVALGVGFLAGTLVYGDTATAAFYDDLARSARGVDVAAVGRLDPSTVDRIRAVPGVAAVDGRSKVDLPLLAPDGRLIADGDRVGVALSPPGDPRLAAFDVAAGRLPATPGEIALDRSTVGRHGFALGGPVKAIDQPPMVLVGVVDLGVNRRYLGRSVAVVPGTTAIGFTEVVVAAAAGTDRAALRDRVAGVVPPGTRVLTGNELRRELATEAAKYVDGFLWVLLAFGIVALTVCGFVIYNTFAILAAQRSRELALLRCLGASRRQIAGAVGLEALALGVVGSITGLAASALVGSGLIAARETVGAAVPAHAPVVSGRTVAVALGVGILLPVVSALVPAIGAGRRAPLAALHADPAPGRPTRRQERGTTLTVPSHRGRRRLGLAAVLLAAGGTAAIAGVPRGFAGLPLVIGGGMLVFLGLVAVAPYAVGPLIGALGRLGRRPIVKLAAGNAGRNPYRTAAVAMALLVGVALMSLLSVLLATARTQSDRELTENFPVDFVVTRLPYGSDPTLPAGLADTLRRGGASVTAVRTRVGYAPGPARLVTVWAIEPGGQLTPEVTDGTPGGPADGQVALGRRLAWQAGISVGDTFTVSRTTRRVVALYDDTPVAADALVSWVDFTAAYGPGGADRLLVSAGAAPGTPPGATLGTAGLAAVLDAAVRDQPLIRVQALADARAQLAGSLDELLAIFGALLGLSVLIAVFGITNTLALSTLERTHETATLWALGLSRRRLRGMLLVEAGLIATLGAAGGVALGVGVGWVAATGLIGAYGHGAPTVPVAQLVLFTALAVAAALLAAVLPARRAAGADLNLHL